MWHVSYVTSYWNSGKKPWHDPHTDCDLRTSQERSKSLEPTVGPSHKVILKGIPLGRLNSNPICLFRTDTYWANLSSKLLNHWSELLRPFQKPQHHTTSTENSPQSLQQRNSVKTGCSKKTSEFTDSAHSQGALWHIQLPCSAGILVDFCHLAHGLVDLVGAVRGDDFQGSEDRARGADLVSLVVNPLV